MKAVGLTQEDAHVVSLRESALHMWHAEKGKKRVWIGVG